jgi:uncharacterized membrane protein
MRQRWIICLAAWGLVLILANPLLAQNNGGTRLRLRFSNMDTNLIPASIVGNGINRLRMVVGDYTTSANPGVNQAFSAVWESLAQPLALPPSTFSSKATCINDSGQIGGVYQLNTTFTNIPVLWTNGLPVPQALPTGTFGAGVTSINNPGRIAAWLIDAVFINRAFAKDPTGPWVEMLPLGGSPQDAYPYCLNDSGNAGGRSFTASGYHACTWTPAGAVTDQGVLAGNNYSTILACNNAGAWVGYCENTTTTAQVPFVIPPGGTMAPLPAPTGGGYANGINANGVISGVINTAAGPHGALWQPGPTGAYPTYIDLNTIITNLPSGVTVTSTNGINAQGAIVGGDSTGKVCILYPFNVASAIYLLLGQ